jgi:hypothetical protein
MKKFKELTPADFPGYDPVKIEEWMAAANEANGNYIKFMGGLLLLFVVISFAVGTLVFPGLILVIFVPAFIFRRTRKIEKELKINRRIVMMARRGELIAPEKRNPA